MQTVCFGLGEKYDSGRDSGVALSGNRAVEVHKSENYDELWYRVGRIDLGVVTWKSSQKYDKGVLPAIGHVPGGTRVVEVHKSQTRDMIFYHVGTVTESDTIVWSDSKQLTEGVRPKVAVAQHGVVVVVYSKGKNDLYYVVGQLDAKGEIAWGAPTRYANGTRPGVALTNDARVIEVHQDNADKPSIYWMMGGINGTTITFANTGQLLYPEGSQGRSATVAFNASTSQAICIHEREAPDQPKLISNIGIVEKDRMNIQWIQGEIHSFDTGRNPSVATYDEFAVQTHAGGDQKEIWCSVSMVLDRNTWMERMAERLDLKPLWKLTLPASHDSGMYALEDKRVREECRDLKIDVPVSEIKKYAKTQSRTIGEQLAAGIRYFDLRPVHDGGNFRVYHDLEGPNFLGENGILQQIATFFKGVQKELVIIKLKKFCNFDSNAHRLFIGEIQARLTNYLWDPGTTVTGEQLLHTTFGTFINSGPRLLIIYHDDYISEHPTTGFWHGIPIYDEYSNTDSYEKMRDDQKKKLNDNPGNEKKMFLLSWTLTTQWYSEMRYASLHDMSRNANRHLGRFCHDHARQKRINFLFVDYFEDAHPTDIAVQINGIA